ncbi:MAG: cupin domain-containing protein [Chthoniobacterales bacterium]|nr:cupin domain-containing protein [Chthoniobacterales bacterium]
MIGDADKLGDSDLFDDVTHPTEHGLIIRKLAAVKRESSCHEDEPQAKRFSFRDLYDVEAQITDLAPTARTELHRHSYEALFYVISGTGYSMISVDAGETNRIEWQAGDLFATPRGIWHQHANGSSSKPARLLEVTTAPLAKAWATHWLEKREQEFTASSSRSRRPEQCGP